MATIVMTTMTDLPLVGTVWVGLVVHGEELFTHQLQVVGTVATQFDQQLKRCSPRLPLGTPEARTEKSSFCAGGSSGGRDVVLMCMCVGGECGLGGGGGGGLSCCRDSCREHLKQGQRNLNSVLVAVVLVVMCIDSVCVEGGGGGGGVVAHFNQQLKCRSPQLLLGTSTTRAGEFEFFATLWWVVTV